MVGIRSITYHLPEQITEKHLVKAARLSRMWDRSFPLIRTQRLCLCPFSEPAEINSLKPLSSLCDMSSIRWFNVPISPKQSQNISGLFGFAHDVLAEYGRAFVNVLGVENGELCTDIFDRCAELIRRTSILSASGQDNFRLGISINVRPNGPFFPFTYSSGKMGFSIALELTQEINEICAKTQGGNLSFLRSEILASVIPQIQNINTLAATLAEQEGVSFHGFDFSLAPIIDENGSIITILNRLGVYNFGYTGTLFATSFLTNILKALAARFPSVGFLSLIHI